MLTECSTSLPTEFNFLDRIYVIDGKQIRRSEIMRRTKIPQNAGPGLKASLMIPSMPIREGNKQELNNLHFVEP